MEFTEEFVQENGLTDDQIKAISGEVESHVAELKGQWDGKANENAEKIIDGAAQKVEQLTGIKREQGQKIADYLNLASENYLKGQKSDLERQKIELQTKIKNGEGSQALKDELDQVKTKLDGYKQMEAEYSEWKENDYKGKYEQTSQELSGLKLNVAFRDVKPSFPDSVNPYEAKAKWDGFVNNVKEKYNIELDKDGEAIAVDKENEHKKVKLSSLVEKEKELQELVKGRQITGLGGKKADTEIEGVPFKVNSEASKQEITKQLKEYLTGELKLNPISSEYSKKFAEIYQKIAQKTAK